MLQIAHNEPLSTEGSSPGKDNECCGGRALRLQVSVSNFDHAQVARRSMLDSSIAGIQFMIYSFSIRDADGFLEALSCMSLPNDVAAEDFGGAVIRDMLLGNPDPHASGTMCVVENERVVCCTHFSKVHIGPKCPAN